MDHSLTRRGFLAAAPALCKLSAQNSRTFGAGSVSVNITPNLGANIAGSMQNHVAEDIHDQLYAKSLVLDNGASRLAFVVCDSCAIAPEVIAKAKALIAKRHGLEPHRVLVAATHSHSSPAAARLFQSEPDPAYQELLSARIADSVTLAIKRLQRARIGWGVGSDDEQVFHRRYRMKPGSIPADPFGRATDQVLMNPGAGNANIVEPAGPVDPEVCLLGVESIDGRPICALGSYALHYVGVPSRTISADYFGVWADEMRWRLGADDSFTGILANACSGNINNVNFMSPAQKYPPFVRMKEVAEAIADEAMRVWQQIRWQDSVSLNAVLENVSLSVRKPTSRELEAAKKIAPVGPASERRQIYAKETIQLQNYPDRVDAPVQAMRIGDLGIATFPGEAFVELGLEVKKKSPFQPTFLIELANSYLGYIPTPEAHRQGGYETWRAKSSFLEVDASPKLVDAALRALRNLKQS